MKQKISNFPGRSGTQFILPATDERTITTSSGFTSDFGDLTVHLHRYMARDYSASADATDRILGIVASKFKIAYLNGMSPRSQTFAKRGATTDARIDAELTVESLNERTSFFMDGFLKTV